MSKPQQKGKTVKRKNRKYDENEKIKVVIDEAASRLRGVSSVIPEPIKPIPESQTYDEYPSLVKPTLFSSGFGDCILSLSLVGGFISLGICLGLNMR